MDNSNYAAFPDAFVTVTGSQANFTFQNL